MAVFKQIAVAEDAAEHPIDQARQIMLGAYSALKYYKQAVADGIARIEQSMMDHIKEHGGFQVGEMAYSVGQTKTLKPKSVSDVAEALLTASGGDMDALYQCLSANAFKPAAVRTAIGDEPFGDLYEVKFSDKLELKALNTKFIKGKPNAKKDDRVGEI